MGTIDDYLETLDPPDAVIIAHTYEVARGVVPDAEQGLGYGMPALTYRGKSLSVMRAKAHFGVYPFSPAAIVEILPLLDGVDHAKEPSGSPSLCRTRRSAPSSPRARGRSTAERCGPGRQCGRTRLTRSRASRRR
jgi:hypothetical protein